MEQGEPDIFPHDEQPVEKVARQKRHDAYWWVVIGIILALLTAAVVWLLQSNADLEEDLALQQQAIAETNDDRAKDQAILSQLQEEMRVLNSTENPDSESTQRRLSQIEGLINSITDPNTTDNVVVIPGPQGIQGIQGVPGKNGKPGADSTVPGPQGDQGIQGIAGADSTVPGPPGPEGQPGRSGTDGTNGTDGKDGADGVGVQAITCAFTGGSPFAQLDFEVQLTNGTTLVFACVQAN